MVADMPTRLTSLFWTILFGVGGLCFWALSYVLGQIFGDFVGGWVAEEIGARTGIEEVQVKAILAGWLPAVAIIAFAMWVTFIATRWRFRDARPQAPGISEIDREALAREAEDVSDRVLELVAEFEGRMINAFHYDAGNAQQDPKQADVQRSVIEGQMLARYAMSYNSRFERVVNTARKVLSFNDSEYWHYTNLRPTQIAQKARYISKIATDLRRPGPDIPEHRIGRDGKLEWTNRVDSVSFGLAAPPSPYMPTNCPAALRRSRWLSWWRTGTTPGKRPG